MLRRKLWNKMIALGLCISMAVGGNAAGFLTESMAYGSEFSDGEEQNQKESGKRIHHRQKSLRKLIYLMKKDLKT